MCLFSVFNLKKGGGRGKEEEEEEEEEEKANICRKEVGKYGK